MWDHSVFFWNANDLCCYLTTSRRLLNPDRRLAETTNAQLSQVSVWTRTTRSGFGSPDEPGSTKGWVLSCLCQRNRCFLLMSSSSTLNVNNSVFNISCFCVVDMWHFTVCKNLKSTYIKPPRSRLVTTKRWSGHFYWTQWRWNWCLITWTLENIYFIFTSLTVNSGSKSIHLFTRYLCLCVFHIFIFLNVSWFVNVGPVLSQTSVCCFTTGVTTLQDDPPFEAIALGFYILCVEDKIVVSLTTSWKFMFGVSVTVEAAVGGATESCTGTTADQVKVCYYSHRYVCPYFNKKITCSTSLPSSNVC